MRYFRYAFLALLAVVLITVALANRDFVTLRVLPDALAELIGLTATISLPLFVVIFAGIVAGILIGFVWEWFREHKQRAEAGQIRKERDRLRKVVASSRTNSPETADDVLSLLEDAR